MRIVLTADAVYYKIFCEKVDTPKYDVSFYCLNELMFMLVIGEFSEWRVVASETPD